MTSGELAAINAKLRDPESDLRLLYVTPERVAKATSIWGIFVRLAQDGRLTRFVIDEVRWAVAWGAVLKSCHGTPASDGIQSSSALLLLRRHRHIASRNGVTTSGQTTWSYRSSATSSRLYH